MSLKKLFGKRLRELRKQKGLTQEELAELCDMQTNSIGLIETGQRAVSFSTIEKFVSVFGIDYSELFNFNDMYKHEFLEDKFFHMFYNIIKKFDESTMQYLLDYTRSLKKFVEHNFK